MNYYNIYTKLVSSVRSSKVIFKILFGFYPAKALWGQYWDWTTLVLRQSITKHLLSDLDFLDMGCGPYAVLSRYARIKLSCRSVTAVDHCCELIAYAQLNDQKSGINYLCSDLFSDVAGSYSLIAFNAPYLEEDKGQSLGLLPDELTHKRFCGGADGASTIQRFLNDLPEHLKPGGMALLGVNHYHIKKEVVRAAIHKSGLKIVSHHENPLTKACVYEIMEKDHAKV